MTTVADLINNANKFNANNVDFSTVSMAFEDNFKRRLTRFLDGNAVHELIAQYECGLIARFELATKLTQDFIKFNLVYGQVIDADLIFDMFYRM